MALKRERPSPHPQASSSSSMSVLAPKFARPTELASLSNIAVYIVPAKLPSETIEELGSLIEASDAILCSDPNDADVLVTDVHMRRRLERHVDWELAKEKAVVTPDWIRDSIKARKPRPCGDYAALQDLHDTSVINCPDNKSCTGCNECRSDTSSSENWPSNTMCIALTSSDLLTSKNLDHTSRYACQRASPLVCPNQDLVRELAIIQKSRALEGEERSSLSYQRAIGTIKACPYRLTSSKQLKKLPHIGPKIQTLVSEFIDMGHISDARTIQKSERFKSLSIFTSVYGIGPTTARRLYGLRMRTLDDLKRYYGAEDDTYAYASPQALIKQDGIDKLEPQLPDELLHEGNERGIREALRLHADLMTKIPRDEVREIGRLVFAELDDLEPGCLYTICGGYRRGKPYSNDVDIVFTHPDMGKEKDLCNRLVQRLRERGMVSHVMHLAGFHAPTSVHKGHWDSLEKALTVISLPPSSPFYQDNGKGKGIHRQMDLICAPANVYWCAVIGWTGSIMFQRDLRQWVKDKKGWKFDSSGLMRRSDATLIIAKSELEVFELCGLEWIDPTMRNADA